MQGGEKEKQYTPKPKAWKEERSPPKSKASAPFKQNNSTESRGRGVREETHKQKPQRPAGTASPNHLSRQHWCSTPQHQHLCIASVGTRCRAQCWRHATAICRGRFWRTSQWAAGENKTQQENETPAIPAHPHGTQPSAGRVLVPHSQPLGLPGNQTPPQRHSALLAQVKREQSSCGETAREHPGPQVPEWEGG